MVYSRRSRFFCDCGAGGVRGQSCACLQPRPPVAPTSDAPAAAERATAVNSAAIDASGGELPLALLANMGDAPLPSDKELCDSDEDEPPGSSENAVPSRLLLGRRLPADAARVLLGHAELEAQLEALGRALQDRLEAVCLAASAAAESLAASADVQLPKAGLAGTFSLATTAPALPAGAAGRAVSSCGGLGLAAGRRSRTAAASALHPASGVQAWLVRPPAQG